MNKEELQTLLDRVRVADGPDRELDAAVLKSLGLHSWAGRMSYPDLPMWVDFGGSEITGSIDAALALTERVLPINSTRLVSDPSGCSCAITWWPDGLTGEMRVQSSEAQASLSLAIVAATLSAMIEAGRIK